MKKLIYLVVAIVSFGATACQEQDPMMFEDSARVQFTSAVDDYSYSFIWSDKSVTSAVVKLPIRIIGGPKDVERTLNVVQVDEFDVTYQYDNKGYVIDSTVTPKANPATAGLHYVPFDDPEAQQVLKVKAGVVQDSLSIIVKRDPSLTDTKVRLRVRIQDSEDFLVGESKYLERTIVISDMLEQPTGWYYKNYYTYSAAYSYLGNYSVPKHELMIKVLQELQGSNSRVDDEWINKGNADPTVFVYWRAKFVEALEKFNNDPANIASGAAPLKENPNDPSSTLVSFPSKVQ